MKFFCLPLTLPILALQLLVAAPASAQSNPAARQAQAGQRSQLHFGQAVLYDSAAPVADGVAVADLNGDGKLDLVLTNYCQSWNQFGCQGEGQVSVLLGNGDGTFQPAVTYSTAAYNALSVAVADLNGDGTPDVVVADACQTPGHSNCVGQAGAVSVLLGNGDGTLQPAVVYSSGANYAYSVAIGDLTGNGVPDLVVSNIDLVGGSNGSVAVLLGNGDGTFQPAVSYETGVEVASAAIGDVNGDGIPDLVAANYSCACDPDGGEVAVLLGNGDGTFQPAVLYDSGGQAPYSVALADLRGNGILDVVVANLISQGALGVLLGNGDGTFQPVVAYLPRELSGGASGSLAAGDVNGDGIPDLVVTELCTKENHDEVCEGTGLVNVFLGNGDGTFQKAVVYSSGGYAGSATAIGDVNGDGRPDLIATNADISENNDTEGTAAVLLNETYYASKTALTSSPNPAQVNQTVAFTATITPTPPNGEVVTFYNGKTELGTGATTNGVATLTTSFSAAKTYTIKSAYPGDPFRKPSKATVKQVVNP